MYEDYSLDDVKKSAEQKLFTVVSTFSGGGGSSTGYKLAGGDVKCVVEFQKIGIQTYLANYPNTKFFCKDIRKVTGEQILKRIKMAPGELDIFDGSPPCPPFSMSGSKRDGWNKTKKVYGFQQSNIEDLSFDVVRLVNVVQPKVFICENVKGLTMAYAYDHFQTIMDKFTDCGYEVDWKVMNSKDYGVPQGRERVFIVGVRDDVIVDLGGKLRLRKLTDFEGNARGLIQGHLYWLFPEKQEIVTTLRDAIGDMMTDEENIKEHDEIMEQVEKKKGWKYLSKMALNVDKYVELAQTVHAEMTKEFEADPENAPKPKYSGFQVRRVPWDTPSHTLTERGLQIGTMAHLHPGEHRGFTSLEAKKIMSLPSDYILTGNLNERLARVGLMVAPRQMEHLAKSIHEKVLEPYKEKIDGKSI